MAAQDALRRTKEEEEELKRLAREERRRMALTPSAKSPEEIAMEDAYIESQAGVAGQKEYSEKKWRGGKGLLGLTAPLLNKFGVGGVQTADEYTDSARTRLTQARDLKNAARERTGLDKYRAAEQGLIDDADIATVLSGRQDSRNKAGIDARAAESLLSRNFQATAGSSQEYEDKDGKIVNVIELRDGSKWETDEANKPTIPFDPRGYIPYVPPSAAGSAGTRQAASALKLQEEQQIADVGVDPFTNNLEFLSNQTSDVLQGATGLLDLERAVGKYGLAGEDDPYYNRIQETNNVINALTFESAAPLLDNLGIASDTDVRISFDAAGGENANINTVVGAYKRTVIPTIIGKARARGVRSTEEIDAIEAKLYSYINKMEDTLIAGQNDKFQQDANPQAQSEARAAEIRARIQELEAM